MAESGLIDIITNAGGLVGLSVFVIWIFTRNAAQQVKDAQNYAEAQRADKVMILEALRESTKAMTEATAAYTELKQVIARFLEHPPQRTRRSAESKTP